MEQNKFEPEQQGAGQAADGPQLDQSGQPESAQGGQEESPQSAPTGPPPEGDHQAELLPNHEDSHQVPELTNQVGERFSLNHRESTPRSPDSPDDGDGDDRIAQGDHESLHGGAYDEGYEHGLRDGLDDHSSESSLDSRSSESDGLDSDDYCEEDYDDYYDED